MCDGEVVAHRQAPHSASDTGGDALPPQVSHPSRCAPIGGFRVSIGCFSEAFVEMNTGTRSCGYDYSFKQQKSQTMKMNSNQSAGIQHVRGCHTSKTGRELCSVKLMLMSCRDERMLTRVPNPMLNEALKQTKCCCEFTSSFTSNTAATAARQLLKKRKLHKMF